MGWISVGALAVPSLLASIATLIVAWRILGTARRSERAGDERLEILREQQQRLAYLDEERRRLERVWDEEHRQLLRVLEQALELLREERDEQRRRPELPPASATAREEEGRESRETPAGEGRSGTWWRDVFGG